MRRKTVSETSKAFGETEERCNDSIMIMTMGSIGAGRGRRHAGLLGDSAKLVC